MHRIAVCHGKEQSCRALERGQELKEILRTWSVSVGVWCAMLAHNSGVCDCTVEACRPREAVLFLSI